MVMHDASAQDAAHERNPADTIERSIDAVIPSREVNIAVC